MKLVDSVRIYGIFVVRDGVLKKVDQEIHRQLDIAMYNQVYDHVFSILHPAILRQAHDQNNSEINETSK